MAKQKGKKSVKKVKMTVRNSDFSYFSLDFKRKVVLLWQ